MSDNYNITNERMYSVGRVVVDKSLHTQSADEPFFRFFGNDVIYSIRRTIEEEDHSKLTDALDAASDGSVRRTVLRMRGISGELRWIMASVRKLPDNSGAEPLYSIAFSDIFSLEELVYSRQKKLSDCR